MGAWKNCRVVYSQVKVKNLEVSGQLLIKHHHEMHLVQAVVVLHTLDFLRLIEKLLQTFVK